MEARSKKIIGKNEIHYHLERLALSLEFSLLFRPLDLR